MGEGDILFSDYVQGQMAGFKGKTNEVGFRASVKPGPIYQGVCACLHTICVEWTYDLFPEN